MTCQALYRGVLHHPALWCHLAAAMYGNHHLADYQSRDTESEVRRAKWEKRDQQQNLRDDFDDDLIVVRHAQCCWITIHSSITAPDSDSIGKTKRLKTATGKLTYEEALSQFKQLV
jgi:hypothetical protein